MSQEGIERIVRSIKTPPPSKTWLAWVKNQLTWYGLRCSATPLSRHFDSLHQRKHILFTGLDAAGKSTLLTKYFSQDCGRDVVTYIPIIGWSVEQVSYANMSFYTLDLGCARKQWVRRLEKSLVAEMDAVVWILDCNDRDRMVEAREELQDIVLAGGRLRREAPILFLSNKIDLPNAMKRREYEQIFASILDHQNWHIAETNMVSGDGLSDAFRWLSDQLLSGSGKETLEVASKATDVQSSYLQEKP